MPIPENIYTTIVIPRKTLARIKLEALRRGVTAGEQITWNALAREVLVASFPASESGELSSGPASTGELTA